MGNLKVFIDLGAEGSVLSKNTTLWTVRCGGEQCPAATTCALGSLILDADGSVMKHGGTADVDVKVYKGPESPASGEDFELVGELNLGSIPMAPNAEHRIEDQALEGMVDRIGEHLDAGRCLVKLVQEQTRMPV